MMDAKRVAFKTLGCKVNSYDTAAMIDQFKREGYEVVPFASKAQIYIINTCAVTTMAAQKSRKLIRQTKALHPQALVVAAGCYPQAQEKVAEELREADLFVGTKERGRLLEHIEEGFMGDAVRPFSPSEPYEDLGVSYPRQTRAYLKVQDGCAQGCSYCIIPRARGPLRSRSLESTLEEAKRLLDQGHKELILTGIHLGAYGEGMEYGLVDVVKEILKLNDGFRLRLSSLEITELEPDLISLFAHKNPLAPHLHLPLQSGSLSILQKMGRPYSPKEYLQKTQYLQKRIPRLSITTDMMVGFPGETEEDFIASCQLAKEVGFSSIHVFPYSKRPMTPAAMMKDQVPERLKRERMKSLHALSHELARAFQKRYLGQEVEVIVEESKDGVFSGLTDNYCRVFFKGEGALQGQILKVSLVRLTDEGIWGTIQ